RHPIRSGLRHPFGIAPSVQVIASSVRTISPPIREGKSSIPQNENYVRKSFWNEKKKFVMKNKNL
ncbi:MAG: hypothetical protein ACI4RD_06575, partial [Kiritimatiellia bacterium]